MTIFEERFLQLKAEVEDLKINIEEKEKAVGINRDKCDLTSKFEDSLKNDNLRWDIMKDYVNAMFDYLHASNDLINKISEKVSNEFEDQINKLHKVFLRFDGRCRNFNKIHYKTISKLEEIKSKMNRVLNRKDIELIGNELSPLVQIPDKQFEEIKNDKKEVQELDIELTELSKKIKFMIEGFDSILDFLEGNRPSKV